MALSAPLKLRHNHSMNDAISVFNRANLRRQQVRSAQSFERFRFLHDWCEKEITDRLAIIRRDFPLTAIINDRTQPAFRARLTEAKAAQKVISLLPHLTLRQDQENILLSDSEILSLAPQSMDMIISIMDLHKINDLPGALVQIRQALKPDGMFIACMAGGETLHELRQVLMAAELETRGGASPRVFPFADKQQMGALLQRAGFALPVVDSDVLRVTYRDIFHLMEDLRGMGESNIIAARSKTLTPKSFFLRAAEIYQQQHAVDGGIEASFEIISMIGWAPHSSQPRALRPGSAQARLADALGTEEIKTN